MNQNFFASYLLYAYKLSRAETFAIARSKNREIYDIYFREVEENIFFASINFRDSLDNNENFHDYSRDKSWYDG